MSMMNELTWNTYCFNTPSNRCKKRKRFSWAWKDHLTEELPVTWLFVCGSFPNQRCALPPSVPALCSPLFWSIRQRPKRFLLFCFIDRVYYMFYYYNFLSLFIYLSKTSFYLQNILCMIAITLQTYTESWCSHLGLCIWSHCELFPLNYILFTYFCCSHENDFNTLFFSQEHA